MSLLPGDVHGLISPPGGGDLMPMLMKNAVLGERIKGVWTGCRVIGGCGRVAVVTVMLMVRGCC